MTWPFRADQQTHAQQCKRKHDEQDAAQFTEDVQAVMKTTAGRRLFMRLLHEGGVYRHSMPDDVLPYVAGRRDAALEIMHAVNLHAVGQSLTALQEHNAFVEHRNAERHAALSLDLEKKGKQT